MNKVCVVNGLKNYADSKYLNLNLLGKPLFTYTIDTAIESKIFDSIVFYCTDEKILNKAKKRYGDLIDYNKEIKNYDLYFEINAYCPLLSINTLKEIYKKCLDVKTLNVTFNQRQFKKINNQTTYRNLEQISDVIYVKNRKGNVKTSNYLLKDRESVIVVDANSFELALVLMNKIKHQEIIAEQIREQIKKKIKVNRNSNKNNVLLIGHSQFAMWDIKQLDGYRIENWGISGIDSVQYLEEIINRNLIDYKCQKILIILGINDITNGNSNKLIIDNINYLVKLFKKYTKQIYVIECCKTNGQIIRDNNKIESFNKSLKKNLIKDAKLITLEEMTDQYGELANEYTYDGLHFSKLGYKKFEEIILRSMV